MCRTPSVLRRTQKCSERGLEDEENDEKEDEVLFVWLVNTSPFHSMMQHPALQPIHS